MKKINFSFLFLFVLNVLSAQTEVIMNVGSEKRQTLVGTGASLTDHLDLIPEGARKVMSDMTFKDFNMNSLRMWNWGGSTFNNQYVATRAIEFAQQGGVVNLLLGPGNGVNPPSDMTAYANNIAARIKGLKDASGYVINVTGVANEPDNWKSNHLADGISKIRTALDANSLGYVKIVGPESSNCDDHWYDIMMGVKSTYPAAWAKLDYVASHSYNMCATEKWAQLSFNDKKDYWMTESANDGVDSETNDSEATSLAARFLNDMNHGVVNWIYFIAYSGDMGNTMTKLLTYDAANGKIFIPCKYYFMKQVYNTFKRGAVFRKVFANGTGEMDQTYNNKSPYNSAVAQNPDGTWSIGAINGTGIQGFVAKDYKFNFDIPELASAGNIEFKVLRTNVSKKIVDDGTVTMVNGKLSVVIGPKEIVTLTNGATQPHVAVSDFALEQSAITMALRTKIALKPIFSPTNATIKGIIWKSSNNSAVNINDKGEIIALFPTTVTITATTADGAKIATCTVTARLENKLSGAVLSNDANEGATDASKVFDANFETYFNALNADNAWVGLDFGNERSIATIKLSPRIGFANRMVGGKIQGSNNADFSESTDLLTVTSTLNENVQNVFINTNTTPYRYARYLSPVGSYGNLSELQFWTDPNTALKNMSITKFTANPNPFVNGNLSINFESVEYSNDTYIQIVDLIGKVKMFKKLTSNELSQKVISINRSQFKSGFYTISILINGESKSIKLLVK